MAKRNNSFKSHAKLKVGNRSYSIASLSAVDQATGGKISRFPMSMKILLENLLRLEDGVLVTKNDIQAIIDWDPKKTPEKEIAFMPARVLLQDFTGVPAVVDLAAMRVAMRRMGGDPARIEPLQPVDLVIDHSVQVDCYGSSASFGTNAALEYERNQERYLFLRWGQKAFGNFRVVPPDTGIVHQVNVEYLGQVVFRNTVGAKTWAYPDTLVGTDSHTPMINGLGVVGWGVGGIEAEAAMLGRPISMLIPEVIGFKMTGSLPPGTTATDLVLTVTQILRKRGVVGRFVEFYGAGLSSLSVADRATISNMAPEYGATIGYFPIDANTINFLRFTGREESAVRLVEAYAKEQGLFRTDESPDPIFTDSITLDLSTVEPSIAGPKRPQDKIELRKANADFRKALVGMLEKEVSSVSPDALGRWVNEGGELAPVNGPAPELGHLCASVGIRTPRASYNLGHGSVVIAAITSCTNTSNPSVLIAAGLLAKRAVEKGLDVKPWVKTSLAPGSTVVTEYLNEAGLMPYLQALGFHLVGYGCTTCIGNSGPLPEEVSAAVKEGNLVVASVLSGNRNFEGRINPDTRANYLMSPPLVVAYAIAGTINKDLTKDPLGYDPNGDPVYLKDIWPSTEEVAETVRTKVTSEQFKRQYADVFTGDKNWQALQIPEGTNYAWKADSSYIQHPPYFDNMPATPAPLSDIANAYVLASLGDSVTTDHISPAGNIKKDSPAGKYLISLGIEPKDFNSYGARRGNHEVMMRGTFANIRLKNFLVPGVEGGVTVHLPDGEGMSIYDAAMKYKAANVPTIIIAGQEYGSVSSRDWAANGTYLLGVKAVIAESFERIHRSNLVGMGVIPCQFINGENREKLGLTGKETFDILGIAEGVRPGKQLTVRAKAADGSVKEFKVLARIDTPDEVDYINHGGIRHYVLRTLLAKKD
jgi:aconitate hydratase